MKKNEFLKSELGRGFSGLAGVRATTRARVTTMLAGVTTTLAGKRATTLAGVMNTAPRVTTMLARVTTMLALLLVSAVQGAWARNTAQAAPRKATSEKVTFVYDFAAAAAKGENPANLNGSASNGTVFYIWETDTKTDSKRQDFKGYVWNEGSVLPQVCHVWRRSDRINGNIGDGGLKCPSDREMVIDGIYAGSTVTIEYDATNATDKEMIWAVAITSDNKSRALAKIGDVDAVSGVSTIPSGATITVVSVMTENDGPGYIAFKVKQGMIIQKITVVTMVKTGNDETYKVSLKADTKDDDKWKAKAGEGDAKALPLEGVAEGEKVTLQYEGRKRVMSVRATKKAAAWDGDLSKLTGSEPEGYATATDGMTITGTLADGVNVKVTIAAGATVTLKDATINGVNDEKYKWAGLTCEGNATIILSGTNTVRGFYKNYPGINVPKGSTLTIRGEGSLTATPFDGGTNNSYGAGIGGGFEIACGNIMIEGGSITAKGGYGEAGIGGGDGASCGDIRITGGTVEAKGGDYAAGIGSGLDASCGNITITGGTVEAKGGDLAAGIGSGDEASCGDILITGGTVKATGGNYAAGIGSGYDNASCLDITLTSGVTKVTATKGKDAPNSIGMGWGNDASCGAVTIGCTLGTDGKPEAGSGKVYNDGISQGKYIYPEKLLPLTMEALTDGTIKVEVDEEEGENKVPTWGMQYAVNDGEKNTIKTTETINVKKGYRVTFYGSGKYTDCYYGTKISGGDAEVMVYGNIMSLVDETGFASANALSQNYAFANLFYKNTTLKDASGLLLPATMLAENCYDGMFYRCSALTAGPAELPAMTLADFCYSSMFYYCTSLTAAPTLPSTTLAKDCYNNMFNGCSRLTAAPRLPAEKLVESCYWMMFYNCTNLASVTCLATDIDATDCLYNWLSGAGSGVTGTKTLYVDKSMKDASWNKGSFTVTVITP